MGSTNVPAAVKRLSRPILAGHHRLPSSATAVINTVVAHSPASRTPLTEAGFHTHPEGSTAMSDNHTLSPMELTLLMFERLEQRNANLEAGIETDWDDGFY